MLITYNRLKTMIEVIIFCSIICSCTKSENIDINNNKLPKYKSISTLRIENYVQRMFIDLLGRESTNQERDSFTAQLKREDLHDSCRTRLVRTLLYDTTYHVGDSSYRHAFAQRIYDISKARFLEGASDVDINMFKGFLDEAIYFERIREGGDSVLIYKWFDQRRQYYELLNSRRDFKKNKIDYRKMVETMIHNSIYDQINMNSFNFVNAAFDNVLLRKPSINEFNRAYDIIQKIHHNHYLDGGHLIKVNFVKSSPSQMPFMKVRFAGFITSWFKENHQPQKYRNSSSLLLRIIV